MPYQIVGIGEILWDVFPDGPRFGGAPANFACCVAEMAGDSAETCVVSAVGDDQLGSRAIESLQSRGVITSFVPANDRPTGRVLVELDNNGIASYRFDEDSAWDHIEWNDDLNNLASRCDAVCFGTLGQRNHVSGETIRHFVKGTPQSTLRILDVNLREPFFSDERILDSLKLANVLKLNSEELPMIAQLINLAGEEIDVMRQVVRMFNLRCVALTRGAGGAAIVSDDSVSQLPGAPVEVVDTVGAGDAFTASMTLDLLADVSLEEVNRNAITAASYVCSKPGATMSFPRHLRR